MKCPFCACSESKVIDSRPTDEGERIRRRRECIACGKRFTTYEIIETVPIIVVKKDKSREAFDRVKLFNGMLRACEKRPVSIAQIETVVSEIEQELQNSLDREVTSVRIGDGDGAPEGCGRGGVCPLRVGLPPVQGYQYVYGGAREAARRKVTTEKSKKPLFPKDGFFR